jgi:hypothetical protein
MKFNEVFLALSIYSHAANLGNMQDFEDTLQCRVTKKKVVDIDSKGCVSNDSSIET